MQSLQISMLGPRAVGKTSLLAAMYAEFQASVEAANLALSLDQETAAILQERLIDLKNLVRGGEGVPFTSGEVGVDALRKRSFTFRVGRQGKTPALEMRFKDYPGGYMSAAAAAEQREFVQQLVAASAAVIIPVDSPALMECNAMYNELSNRPMEVTEFLKAGFENLKEPRLVILAPTKCEKYMRDHNGPQLLCERVQEEYAEMLRFLGTERLREQVAVAITPVQTVGDVIFNRVEVDGRVPRYFFRPVPRARYSPHDSEQPLRYLLAFLINLYLTRRPWGPLNFVRDLFGMDNELREGVRKFAMGCRTTDGFAVVQGRNLLSLGD
jgi:hypothetical protein